MPQPTYAARFLLLDSWTAMTGVIGVASAVRAIAAAAVCVTSTAQGPTLGVQLRRTLNINGGMVDGGRVVAAACFRRPEQEDSKSNSSRTPGPSRALSQSR